MKEGERIFHTMDEVHAFAHRLSPCDLAKFSFQPIFGWRELLAATFGNPARLRFRGWIKS